MAVVQTQTTLPVIKGPAHLQATAMRAYTQLAPAPGHHFTVLQSNSRKRPVTATYLINYDKVKSIRP